MSIKVSSGISLSTNYFLRNFYTNNQKAAKTSGRPVTVMWSFPTKTAVL